MNKKKKELDVNITLERYNRFKDTFRVVDQPDGNIGERHWHDGNVFLEIADEKNNVHINVDKNVFDLIVLTYLQGHYIRYTSGIIKGQLIHRQKKLIKELEKRKEELLEQKKKEQELNSI